MADPSVQGLLKEILGAYERGALTPREAFRQVDILPEKPRYTPEQIAAGFGHSGPEHENVGYGKTYRLPRRKSPAQ